MKTLGIFIQSYLGMHGGVAICNFHKCKYICQVFVSFRIMQVLHYKNIKYPKVFEVKYANTDYLFAVEHQYKNLQELSVK